jgi:L-ascorbate metabolism protein UlaG (beta-lactamase superfamily)
MTISYKGKGQFMIRTKQATIEMGSVVKIGDKILPGRGEYEVSGVEVEGMADGIFLIRSEDMFVLYLAKINRQLTDAELEEVNMADILCIPVGGDKTDEEGLSVLTPEQAVKVINQVDPRIVIPTYFASIEPFRAVEGKPLEMMSEFKVTRSTLPVEDRQVVVLT